MTVDELAQPLYVGPGDARVTLGTPTEEPVSDVLPEGLGDEVRMLLGRHGERTIPQLRNQADRDTWREGTGLRKPGRCRSTEPSRWTRSFRPTMTWLDV
ncbi:hypothetical protein SAMN05216207_10057 [Pseudonocardia ammonioxydans]|uniref:Uncharacterized protein n=2 Tax=Pseudonocardia ammonioxydans TaxID=260086 RepID=A0A1I4UUU5_PSUAM|nr:hypothetical protein SAMN05216207_10057 [Pseudonocardia ammonioxydans]